MLRGILNHCEIVDMPMSSVIAQAGPASRIQSWAIDALDTKVVSSLVEDTAVICIMYAQIVGNRFMSSGRLPG